MILPFKTHLKIKTTSLGKKVFKKKPTGFVPKIKKGIKIHTIREDKSNRWRAGLKIHFATGVRSKNYNCFKKGVVKSIQKIEIKWNETWFYPFVYIDGRLLHLMEIEKLAINDGFETIDDFCKWFDKDFTGKIIHWTDFKY